MSKFSSFPAIEVFNSVSGFIFPSITRAPSFTFMWINFELNSFSDEYVVDLSTMPTFTNYSDFEPDMDSFILLLIRWVFAFLFLFLLFLFQYYFLFLVF